MSTNDSNTSVIVVNTAADQPPTQKIRRYGWQPGKSGNPLGGVRKDTREIRLLARSHCEEAIQKLYSLMNKSKDDRVQLRAAEILLDRGCGHVTSQEQVEKIDSEIPENIRKMSDAELVVVVQRRLHGEE